MITLRKSDDRGVANFGWLDSHHTFSFGEYFDSQHMGFGPLRVINEDRVQADSGFGAHGHKNMEIISYVLEGALEHKDNIGNGSIIKPGDIQRMTAGTGILHSEHNPSKESLVHFMQIWIEPNQDGLEPGYEQRHFTDSELCNQLRLVASQEARDNSIRIHQDADLYISKLAQGHKLNHSIAEGRGVWIQIARGEVLLNNETLKAGDGASIEEITLISLEASEDSEILLFDLALKGREL